MILSSFVTRSAAVVALASLIGCSSSSSSGSSDYKPSKNGCTVTVTGAVTVTDEPCKSFSANNTGIVVTLSDKPAAGDSMLVSANMDSVATGTYTANSTSTELFGASFTVGGVVYSNLTNKFPTNGTVKIDSSETPTVSPQLKTFGGSFTADLYKENDDTAVVGKIVVKF